MTTNQEATVECPVCGQDDEERMTIIVTPADDEPTGELECECGHVFMRD